jgi:hypothetical protein
VIVERRPSTVGPERIDTASPVVVFHGDRDELVVAIGRVDVPVIAFEIVTDMEIEQPDFVAASVRKFARILGEERIERLVVFERQLLTCVKRTTDPQGGGQIDDDGIYVPGKIIPAHDEWAYFGRFGFVAYLK